MKEYCAGCGEELKLGVYGSRLWCCGLGYWLVKGNKKQLFLSFIYRGQRLKRPNE